MDDPIEEAANINNLGTPEVTAGVSEASGDQAWRGWEWEISKKCTLESLTTKGSPLSSTGRVRPAFFDFLRALLGLIFYYPILRMSS